MYMDGAAMCETQSIGCCDSNELDPNSGAHPMQLPGTNSRVSAENLPRDDPQLKDNSWLRYNRESPQAAAWDATSMQSPNDSHLELPQSAYTWTANKEIPYPSVSQTNSNQPRTYGNPILGRQQRPTILVIVVNKPLDNQVYTAPRQQGPNTRAYPIGNYSRGYSNGMFSAASSYPLGSYQSGGANVIHNGNSTPRPTQYDNGQNQFRQNGPNNNEVVNRNGPDSRHDRREKYNCCTCTTEDADDEDNVDDDEGDETSTMFNESGEENDCECTCDIGDLEKTLEGLIPNKDCLCYLANTTNRKKKKKRKPRSVFDRFASPPFVIEPKPNCCMCCCRNRSCCYPCCNNSCCNSCYPWC